MNRDATADTLLKGLDAALAADARACFVMLEPAAQATFRDKINASLNVLCPPDDGHPQGSGIGTFQLVADTEMGTGLPKIRLVLGPLTRPADPLPPPSGNGFVYAHQGGIVIVNLDAINPFVIPVDKAQQMAPPGSGKLVALVLTDPDGNQYPVVVTEPSPVAPLSKATFALIDPPPSP